MDDLDRLFHHIVRAVADRGRERLGEPIQIAELYQELIPYRALRSTLRLESHQDYEMVVLRLLAGERGYARVEPPEVQEALVVEAQAEFPETSAFRQFAAARVYFDASAAETVLEGKSAFAPAPAPAAAPASSPPSGAALGPLGSSPPRTEARRGEQAPGAADTPAEPCSYCGEELPAGREVFYCPFCGGNVKGVRCPTCGSELEVGWSYCITCGKKMARD